MALDSKPEKRVFGLDVLRAVAVSTVLLSHSLYFVYTATPRPPHVFICGWIGVEIFFVLSGFLIGGMLLKLANNNLTFHSARIFWVRRALRTMPNYFVFLAISVLIAWFTAQAIPPLGQYFLFLQNFAWRIPPFYVESWTLTMEEWFYFLLPLALLAVAKAKLAVRHRTVLLIVGFIILITVARAVVVQVHDLAWFWTLSRVTLHADALMYGVLAAWFKLNFSKQWSEYRISLAAAGALLVAVAIWCNFHQTIPEIYYLARTSLFSVTSIGIGLLFPWFDGWKTRGGRTAQSVTCLSLWSYSLYLCQVPVMTLVQFLCKNHLQTIHTGTVAFVLAYIAICILIAAVWFKIFEKPMTDLRDKFAWKS